VGFIKKLPHHLVVSFHATLECVVEADLIVHVVDISYANWEDQIASVRNVLDEIGAGRKEEVLVLNKVDRLRDQSVVRAALRTNEGAVAVSALSGWGLDRLKGRLLDFALQDKREVVVNIPSGDSRALSCARRYGTILSSDTLDGKTRLRLRIDRKYMESLEPYVDSGGGDGNEI
jgi:GTP-binding protein HflX